MKFNALGRGILLPSGDGVATWIFALETGTAALQPDPKVCQREWKHLLHQGCGDGSSPPQTLK